MKPLAIHLIRLYQRAISPLTPNTCRYIPNCSDYGLAAIERHGLARGLSLALRRLLRCTPLHSGGYDPVP
ncbi:MAG: membrane protein insertion efficiency factor YidD [Dehalococcoidia bacterium]|nr:membrane protein insertion efficiency factor YidD [Dehalococcoidia bacterium]